MTDSLRVALDLPSRFVVKLDTRNGFLDGRTSKVRGVKAGWQHGEILQYGIGLNVLWNDPPVDFVSIVEKDRNQLRMAYLSFFAQYTFYNHGHWSVSIPAQLGAGGTWIRNQTEKARLTEFSHPILVYEAMMAPEYRFLKYFHVGAAFGYRLGAIPGRKLEYGFSSPIYALIFRVRLGELWEDINE